MVDLSLICVTGKILIYFQNNFLKLKHYSRVRYLTQTYIDHLQAPSSSKAVKAESGGGKEREHTVAPSPPIVGDEWSEIVDLMNQAKVGANFNILIAVANPQ